MSILAIALSLALFASTTKSEETKLRCIDELNNKIDESINSVRDDRDHAIEQIEEKLETLTSTEPSFWDRVKSRRDETPVIEFNESGDDYRIEYAREINDSACIQFVETFTVDQFDRCSSFPLYLISIDLYEITNLSAKVIKYFIRNKMAHSDDEREAERDEELCREKISRVDFAISVISRAVIARASIRAQERIDNYLGDLSFCLVTQREKSPSLFYEWHDACAYYARA